MEPKINYVFLLLLIIFGVALGNLASSLIAKKYFDKDAEIATQVIPQAPVIKESLPEASTSQPEKLAKPQETVKLSPEGSSESEKESQAVEKPADTKHLIEQRKIDENGIRLAKRCNEWTTVHKDMNTESSERGMNKHCSEYYDYLSFGNLPDTN